MFSFEVEKERYALKPMNCPGHWYVFGLLVCYNHSVDVKGLLSQGLVLLRSTLVKRTSILQGNFQPIYKKCWVKNC